MEPMSYLSIVDGIRTGLRRVQGTDVTETTVLWPGTLDSLDLLELLVFLEDEFGWRLPEDAIDSQESHTVGDLATLVLRTVG
jgi:acyl carrier protein